jgi:TonB-linked SusC/RagA family outer membrane protein
MKKSKVIKLLFRVNPKLNIFILSMKLSVLFLIICLQAYSHGFSQEMISISVKNVELKKLFSLIQKKTSYRFLYYDAVIPGDKKVSINASGASIEQVLDQALSKTSLKYRLMENNLVVISSLSSMAVDVFIKGKITDENDLPLSGASVKVKSASSGTVTNNEGEFAIKVPGHTSLVMFYSGYQPKEFVAEKDETLDLQLVPAPARINTVTGKIVDQQGQPVPFATVRVKGSKQGVAADADGNFSIKVNPGATLIITGANIAPKEVPVDSSPSYNIIVSRSNTSLSEVVVTALGIRRSRNSLPYAAQQISGSEVNKSVTTNFVDNLSGKIAGLQITQANTMGGSTNAILRGMKSLTQSNQALFVIDGVPFDNTNHSTGGFDLGNGASDVDPDNIESISVLKGAAASALYGSRASNGVILITTKKGNRGKGVGVSASFGVTAGSLDPATLPVYQTQYGQGYTGGGNDAGGQYDQPNSFYFLPAFNSNGQNVLIAQTPNDAGTGPAYNPNLMVYNWDAFSPGNPNYGKATPWMPAANHKPTDFFVTPVTVSTNISADGATDKGTFRIGFTHDDNKDFMPNAQNIKNLLSLSATHNVTEKITVGGSLSYSDINTIGRYLYPYTGTTNIMTDFRQWWPTNVNINELKADYFRTLTNATWNWQIPAYTGNTSSSTIGKPAYHDNPYWDRYQNYEGDSRTRYFGNVFVNYKITGNLSLMGRVATDNYNQLVETRNNVGSQTTSFYARLNETYNETNYDLLLNFNKSLGTSFNVKALLGGNIRQDNIQSISASTNGGLIGAGFYSLSNSVNTPNAPAEILERKEVDGIFAGATLSYKDMFTLDGTIRRDQSSTLPSANNTYYYPSVSANFIFSKLLTSAQNWLSFGKLWANYAEVGGDAPYYSVRNTFSYNTPLNGQAISSFSNTNNNQNLLPEENKTYEFGLEASFLNNRMGFTADYYRSRQINQITPALVSQSTGFSTFYVNAGTVQNSGVELTINITPVKTRDFSWAMAINWSRNVNRVLFLFNNQPSFVIAPEQNSIQIVAEAVNANGKIPKNGYGIIRGTDYTYLNGKRVVDSTGHYIQNPNPLSDIGNMNPDWMGGINNTFTYKNISLSFLIDVRKGGQVYSLDMDYGSFSGLYPRTAGYNDLGNPVRSPLTGNSSSGGIILKAVTADGKPNTTRIDESDLYAGAYSFGSLGGGEANKEFVYDAGYIKLREVAITFSLPKKVIDKTGFLKGMDFSIAGRNLWIIHKNEPYADPEQGQISGNSSMGFQNGAYPVVRSVSGILKFKF